MVKDQEIFDLIEREHQRQLKGMELIASENFVSDEVMNAMGSYLTNKYAEGLPGKRYYGGCQVVDIVENLAIERVKKVFGAEYANVQPHSGAQANAAVLLAVLKPGDTFMGLNLDHGGHLSHGSHVNTSGILYNPIGYNLNKETGRVDYDEMEKLALEYKPKLIIGGGSAYSREWDYARMRKIADEVGALLMIDMAHPAGLIAAGLLYKAGDGTTLSLTGTLLVIASSTSYAIYIVAINKTSLKDVATLKVTFYVVLVGWIMFAA